MKKQKTAGTLLMIGCFLFILTACKGQSANNNTAIPATDGNHATVTLETDENHTTATPQKAEAEEQKIDLKNYSLEYQLDTDFQPFFSNTYATKSETGYYLWKYIGDGYMIMFLDKKSGATVPLCNLPNCSHGADGKYESCNAYFNGNSDKKEDCFYNSFVQYYKGNVYITGESTDGYVNVYKIAKDGSAREKSCKLYKIEKEQKGDEGLSRKDPHVCIHRGYVYFIDNDENMPKIRRVKVDSSEEPEVIYETSGVRPNLYRMEAYGDYLFFQAGNFTDETCEHVDGGIYAYNTVSGTTCMIKKDAISYYILKGGTLYYSTEDGVHSFSLSDGKDELFGTTEDAYPEISADNHYIYVIGCESDGIIEIFDDKNKKIDSTILEEATYYFGDDEYLLAERIESNKTTLWGWNKSALTNDGADHKWKELK